MTRHSSKLTAWAAALLALAATASAEIKLNENFSVSGYVEGSYQYTDPKPGESSDHFGIDSSQLVFNASFKPVTGVVSLFYVPGYGESDDTTTVLDAYFTYDAGNGVSITAGKFLSYLGYESFFTVNNPEISFANGDFLGAIPGYHSGVKVDYGTNMFSLGAAVVDSVYSPYSALKGDGELKHNGGFEGYFAYKGTKDLTLWAGVAYDTKGGFQSHSVTTFDFWAQYQIDPKTMVGAEYAHKDGGIGNKGYNWLGVLTHAFTDKFSTAFRVGGEKLSDGGGSFMKYTIAPGVAVTEKLTVRAEYSYYDYKDTDTDKANFIGVQAFFKF